MKRVLVLGIFCQGLNFYEFMLPYINVNKQYVLLNVEFVCLVEDKVENL